MSRSKKKSNQNNIFNYVFWCVLIVILIQRIIFFIQLNNNPVSFVLLSHTDCEHYYKTAQSISQGNIIGSEVYYMNPGYSYILAFWMKLLGDNVKTLVLHQVLLGVLTGYLLMSVTSKMFNLKTAIISGLLYILYTPIMYYESKLLLTSYMTLFVILNIFLYFKYMEKEKIHYLVLWGVCFGMTALIRGNVLLISPIIFFYLLFQNNSKKPKTKFIQKKNIIHSLIFTISVIIMIIPVTIRNYVVGDDIVLISSNAGINFFLGNNRESTGTFSYPSNMSEIIENSDYNNMKPSERSGFWMDRAKEYIKNNPQHFLGNLLLKLRLYIWHFELGNNFTFDFDKTLYKVLMLYINFGIIIALFFAGIYYYYRRILFKNLFIPFIFVVVYSFSIVLFLVVARYRIPITPVILSFSGYTIYRLIYDKNMKRRIIIFVIALLIFSISRFQTFDTITIDPSKGYENIGIAYEKLGKLKESIKYYRKAVEKYSENNNVTFNLGANLMNIGEYREALKYLLKVADHPKYQKAYNAIGYIYINLKEFDKAEEYLMKAYNYEPDNPEVTNNIGIVYANKKEYQKAVDWWVKTLNIDKTNKNALDNLQKLGIDRSKIHNLE